MSGLAPRVVPIFATPFGVVSLPQAKTLNASLAEVFTVRAAQEEQKAGGASRGRLFVSRDDLLTWPEESVQQAMREILSGVTAVAASISELGAAELSSLSVQARAWFTIVRQDGCVPVTSYPNTSWLAVYCVRAPEPSPERADSGVLRIHEARLETSFQDPVHPSSRIPYRRGHCTWHPAPGDMAVFPGALMHEIALVRAAGILTLVTAAVRFAGGSGSWMPPW